MADLTYPTPAEVNELLDVVEAHYGDYFKAYDTDPDFRALVLAARGCKAQAEAYARLLVRARP